MVLVTLGLYFILTIIGFIYNSSYRSDISSWDFGGIIPLIIINLPGLFLYFILTSFLGVEITNTIIWISIIIILNLAIYCTTGAIIGLLVE